MARFVLFKAKYSYSVVNHFAEALGAALADLGREVVFVDLADPEGVEARLKDAFLGAPVEAAVGFGAAGHELTLGDRPLFEALKVPYVAFLVDHPYFHLQRLYGATTLVTCFDRAHVRFLRRLPRPPRAVDLIPHGGLAGRPSPERDIPVLFAGTCVDGDEPRERLRALPDPTGRWAMETVARLEASDARTLEGVFQEVLAEDGVQLSREELLKLVPIFKWIDQVVYAAKRLRCLEVLGRAGVAVDVWGPGWPADRLPGHRFHGEAPFLDVLDLMGRARVVLNLIPTVPDGAHERIFSAMLSGAAVATDLNPFLEDHFGPEDLLGFRWGDLEALPGRIQALIADPVRWEAMAARGRARTLAHHTWGHRAQALLDALALNPLEGAKKIQVGR